MRPDVAHVFQHPRFRAGPWERLPESCQIEAARYIVTGAVMRPFMRAIAAGDLFAAARLRIGLDIRGIADFFDAMPERSHGSYTRVVEWEMIGGLDGIHHLNESIGRVFP